MVIQAMHVQSSTTNKVLLSSMDFISPEPQKISKEHVLCGY